MDGTVVMVLAINIPFLRLKLFILGCSKDLIHMSAASNRWPSHLFSDGLMCEGACVCVYQPSHLFQPWHGRQAPMEMRGGCH